MKRQNESGAGHSDHAEHDPGHGHHSYKGVALRRLMWSLAITTVVMIVEVVGGLLSGSIALVSDAGHMLTHAFAIAVSMFGILIARRPPCHHRTFGLLRAEVLAALVNGLFLIANPQFEVGDWVEWSDKELWIAAVGLVVNVVSILLLESSRHGDLNVGAVFVHMVGDAASSVAIVIAAVVIYFTDMVWIDPVISIGIALWIAVWATGLLRDTARVLLEMAPKGRDVEEIVEGLKQHFPAIVDSHNEHVWTITQDVIVFTAHIVVDMEQLPEGGANQWLDQVEQWLGEHYHVVESTIQMEPLTDKTGSV